MTIGKFIAVTQALSTEVSAYEFINDLIEKWGVKPLPMVFLVKESAGYVVWRRVTEDDLDYTQLNPDETRKWKAAWVEKLPGEIVAEY